MNSSSSNVAARECLSYLVRLCVGGKLSANDVSVLCDLGVKAGIKRKYVRTIAFPDDKQSGAYQRHLKHALKIDNIPYYDLRVPGTDPIEPGRTTVTIACVPSHEQLFF